MARKSEQKHPYTRGHSFWNPIISEWISSDRYTDKAKQQFRESLDEMWEDKNLLNIEPLTELQIHQ